MSKPQQVYVTTWFREHGIVLCELDEGSTISARCGGTAVRAPERGLQYVFNRDVHPTLEAAQAQVDGWLANEASHA